MAPTGPTALPAPPRWRVRAAALSALLVAGLASPSAQAQAGPDLRECAGLPEDAARLACYDKLAVRGGMLAVPASPMVAPPEAVQTAQASGAAPAAVARVAAEAAEASNSLTSRYWELDDADKRGTFNYTGYRPNFFMPLHVRRNASRLPSSSTQGVATNLPPYQNAETKLQLSLRTKVAQDLVLPGADLWVGYTQESLWQLYNRQQSAPFRNTDYQPELIYVVPTPRAWQDLLPGDWRWRMTQLAFVHQSNGQVDPLSRSWNRVYAAAGLERGDVALNWRLEYRTDRDPGRDNNNPDIVDQLGWQQIQVNWSPGRSLAALQWRPSLHGKGSLRLDWSYPVFSDRPDALRWYAQLFHGRGDSLLEYNAPQSSLGLGLSIFKF